MRASRAGPSGLYRAPGVAKPDEKWGEVPCAFVTLKPGAPPATAEALIQWSRDRLAHHKAPKHVVFGPLPKISTGKIQKFVLRERAREASAQPRAPLALSAGGFTTTRLAAGTRG